MKLYVSLCVLATSVTGAAAPANPEVAKYTVTVQPDFAQKSIIGQTEMLLAKPAAKGEAASFDVSNLVVDEVRINNASVPFKTIDKKLLFSFAVGLDTVSIKYHGQPSPGGLTFGADYVYTGFNTCTWMVCDNNPSPKSKFILNLILPDGFQSVAGGTLVKEEKPEKGLVRQAWYESIPYSPYLFGFAAGKFHRVNDRAGKAELRYLGSVDDAKALARKFKDTPRILKFLERKAGVPYPHKTYTQVLVGDDEAQEKDSFAVIGKPELDPIVSDPQEDWAIVHELSHQWWGNSLTCKSWKDFWLNEGITVFMVAAYKEERWGKSAYEKELSMAQKRYQKAIDAKFDKPLTFSGVYPSLSIKRAIVYSKGALFMAALRKDMGDGFFWDGLKAYTRKFSGRSVESLNFQDEMERVYGKSLSPIFQKWVYE
jgi:aminopeptidase N